jgi:hypothetical protein
LRTLRVLAAIATSVAAIAIVPTAAHADRYAATSHFDCLNWSGYDAWCSIYVITRPNSVDAGGMSTREIWIDSTHAVHNAGGYGTAHYAMPSHNPHWQWRACGWFYHDFAPRHIVCSPWVYGY